MASLSLPLAVSMGDPAGIGLEILCSAWDGRNKRGLAPFVLYGDPETLDRRAQAIRLALSIETVRDPEDAAGVFHRALPVIPVALAAPAVPGKPNPVNAPAIIASIELATAAVANGHAAGVVTLPIAKSVLTSAGFQHPGHTEFLGALAGRHWPGRNYRPVMMLAGADLRVVPLTVHIPLAGVARAITHGLILETIRITWAALREDFGLPAPRIAVAGLNPHAGEQGTMGREELDVIIPALDVLREEGLAVSGPHPADTLFHAAARARYDAVIGMYHDQVLIPLKTLAFDSGVNITLGLPFVRTSPDHGTAFDIAGRGIASPESLIAALTSAGEIAARRTRIPG